MIRSRSDERKRRHHHRPVPIAVTLSLLVGAGVVVVGIALVAATLAPAGRSPAAASGASTTGSSGSGAAGSIAPQSSDGWPAQGQGAYVLGDARPAASPDEKPVPIASVAKVMTAYLVLTKYPLAAGASGRTFVVDDQDVVDTEQRSREGQSVVPVAAGEQLTERDALMAILLPSANNVAVLVARETGGSVASFVARMNQTARTMGMTETTYTDPSGYDAGTVSTALDQLRLAQVVARNTTLAAMMSTSSYTLPVAGEITNTDTLLGSDGFVGMKTGSDHAAGGCFMFLAIRHTAAGDVTLIGVVLGQHGPDLIGAGLQAAQQLAERVTPSATHPSAPPLVVRPAPPAAAAARARRTAASPRRPGSASG